MTFHAIAEVPPTRLAHRTGQQTRRGLTSTTTITSFMTYPMDVRRPDDGTTTALIYCGICREHVAVTVPSVEQTRRLQRAWLSLGVLGLVVDVACIAGLTALPGNSGLVLLLLVAGIATLLGLGIWWSEHGVRVAKTESHESRKVHSIRVPTKRTGRR